MIHICTCTCMHAHSHTLTHRINLCYEVQHKMFRLNSMYNTPLLYPMQYKVEHQTVEYAGVQNPKNIIVLLKYRKQIWYFMLYNPARISAN